MYEESIEAVVARMSDAYENSRDEDSQLYLL